MAGVGAASSAVGGVFSGSKFARIDTEVSTTAPVGLLAAGFSAAAGAVGALVRGSVVIGFAGVVATSGAFAECCAAGASVGCVVAGASTGFSVAATAGVTVFCGSGVDVGAAVSKGLSERATGVGELPWVAQCATTIKVTTPHTAAIFFLWRRTNSCVARIPSRMVSKISCGGSGTTGDAADVFTVAGFRLVVVVARRGDLAFTWPLVFCAAVFFLGEVFRRRCGVTTEGIMTVSVTDPGTSCCSVLAGDSNSAMTGNIGMASVCSQALSWCSSSVGQTRTTMPQSVGPVGRSLDLRVSFTEA